VKISPTPDHTGLVQALASSRPDAARTRTGTPAPRSAQVNISATSTKLLELHNGDGDIDMERVNALRDAIASGQLRIDASRIADGLIASARELLK